MIAEIVNVGASVLKSGLALWQCYVGVGNENDDIVPFGDLPSYQGLGLTSLPYPKDENGSAEAVIIRNISGRKGAAVGGRDTRNANVVGKLDPGDTVMHSTGPNQAAQVRCQEKKRMASIVVQDKSGKHQVFVLDGENKKAQLFVNGAAIEIDDSGDITLAGAGGAAILIQGGDIVLNGVVRLPGMPPGMFLYAAPITGPLSTAVGTPVAGGAPVMGVGGTS